MSEPRLYAETECEHGNLDQHRFGKGYGSGAAPICPGGFRRQITVDLVAELRFARDAIQGWAGYASDYFRDKWDLDGDLARIDAAIAALGAQAALSGREDAT